MAVEESCLHEVEELSDDDIEFELRGSTHSLLDTLPHVALSRTSASHSFGTCLSFGHSVIIINHNLPYIMSQLLRQLSSCRLLINNYHQGITRSYSRLSCELYKQLEPSVNKSCQLMPRQNVVLNQYRNSTSFFTRREYHDL